MKINKIISAIEKIAPLSFAAEWDKSGVQIASFQEKVSHIALMLDPTLKSINAALEAGADFILAHHPLSVQARFPDKADDYLKIISLLISKEICLYSAHTSLDANPRGPVRWLGHELELKNMSILDPSADEEHGFGFIGDLPQKMDYQEFSDLLKAKTGLKEWRACGPMPDAPIERIACCPGSGSSLISLAEKSYADIFITGDLKYHSALDATLRIIDVGHFSLEEEMMRRFSLVLEKKLEIPVTFIAANDPFNKEPVAE